MGKKALCLIFAFLFSINSFAAVVSDNDGSAFITKAEFDSLKNNFQSQLDSYNTAIDNKIDAAIASYIAGSKVEKTTTYNVLVKDWGEYTILGGSITNQFALPDVNGTFFYTNAWGSTTSNLWKTNYMYWTINYKRTDKNNRRVLVDNVIIQSTPDLSNATWAGVALNCLESWTLSAQDQLTSGNDIAWLYEGYTQNLWVCQPVNITARNYISNWSDKSKLYWNHTNRWEFHRPSSPTVAEYLDWTRAQDVVSITPVVTYEKNGDNKIFDYEHVGTWRNSTTFECSAKNVTNYLKVSSNNTNKTQAWFNALTKSGKWTGTEYNNSDMRKAGQRFAVAVQWTDNTNTGTTNNADIPTLGLVGNISADAIYQYQDLSDNKGNKIQKLKLQEGVPLFDVKENDKVEWEGIFSDCHISGITGQKEVRVRFSYEPYYDKRSVTDNNNIVKVDSGDSKNLDSVTTTDRKVKISFKAPRDGIIFCKWCPDASDSDLDSKYWEAKLDIDSCNTYKITKE